MPNLLCCLQAAQSSEEQLFEGFFFSQSHLNIPCLMLELSQADSLLQILTIQQGICLSTTPINTFFPCRPGIIDNLKIGN